MTTHVPINPVVKQIAELQNKSFAELKALWEELYGKPPPAYRRGFLTRALAFRIQELVYGGLPPAYQARLDALIDDRPDPARTKRPHSLGADRPVVGTRLIREWRGVEHVVTVTVDGFEYAGRPWKSLSAIARAIAGTRWNGPAFFGLRSGKRAVR